MRGRILRTEFIDTAPPMRELCGMRGGSIEPTKLCDTTVLITGGAGCVGSAIADHLVQHRVREIVIFDNFTRGRARNLEWASSHGAVRVVEGDVRERAAVKDAMRGIDIVFHQAALRVTQCVEDPSHAFEVMVDGTFNVLETARIAGVRKIVVASSAAVYGAAKSFPTSEAHPLEDKLTLYGAAKRFNEALLHSFHEKYGLDYIALRYFNVYGPRMDIEGQYTEVMVRWMERISQGLPPFILGDGKQTMDFIYVSDVARANIMAAASDIGDEAVDVSTGIETSLRDLASMLLGAMGSCLKPHFAPERSVNNVSRRVGDTRRARELLGFNAEVPLNEGLARMIAWWRSVRSLS